MLRRFLRRLRPLDHDRLDRLFQQLRIVNVGAGDHNPHRPAVGLADYATFCAWFAAIRGVWADEIPPKRALPIAPSALCHSQLTPPSSSQFSIKRAQIRWNTPLAIHRCIVRCTELSSPNFRG